MADRIEYFKKKIEKKKENVLILFYSIKKRKGKITLKIYNIKIKNKIKKKKK